MKLGHGEVKAHPDFEKEWCRKILADPEIQWSKRYEGVEAEKVTNSMFEWTLYWDRGIRAHLTFRRPCKETDSIAPLEECFLISLGDGLDGKTGRSHGGLNSILLDHICGHAAHHANPTDASPATATMTVDFKRPINTPCVILARSWPLEASGRKIWVQGVLEDEEGRVLSRAKTLFVVTKAEKL